ncbi:MAG TPA: hypothetical protein VKA76_15730 [Gammaproteobacteria bacterium]|nr:hypothetical protein [Gammaproteobacteria bacterium]
MKCPACGARLQGAPQGFLTTPFIWALLVGGPLLVLVGVVGLYVGGASSAVGSVASVLLGAGLTYVGVRARRR